MARKKENENTPEPTTPFLPGVDLQPDQEMQAEINRRRLEAIRQKQFQIELLEAEMNGRIIQILKKSQAEDKTMPDCLIATGPGGIGIEIVTPNGSMYRINAKAVQRRRT